jgi:hypothetical protein
MTTKGVYRYRSGETVNFPQADFWELKRHLSGKRVNQELSRESRNDHLQLSSQDGRVNSEQ